MLLHKQNYNHLLPAVNFVMDWQLKVSEVQLKAIWNRKKAVESRFDVRIFSPYYEGKRHVRRVSSCKVLKQEDLYCLLVKSDQCRFEALKKYIEEAFVHPAFVSSYCFAGDLNPILGNKLWIEVLEEIHSVYITTEKQSLIVSGTSSSVSSVLSALVDLSTKYIKYGGKPVQDHGLQSPKELNYGGKPLEHGLQSAKELVLALRVCKNVEVDINTLQTFPKEVLVLLTSWLKQACKKNFPSHNTESVFHDNNIVILDVPDEVNNIPVIVLDSDNEHEVSAEELNENIPLKVTSKRKKQRTKKSNKKRKPLLDHDYEKNTGSL